MTTTLAAPKTDSRSSPPRPTSLLRHYLRYLTATVLSIVAGAISLPIYLPRPPQGGDRPAGTF